jgi:methylmalonyl-CoA mutase N-terminal domain/subunit
MGDDIQKDKERRAHWEETTLRRAQSYLGLEESPHRYFGPEDSEGFDFFEKVGYPGEYPFTSTLYAAQLPGTEGDDDPKMRRAGRYSGYATAEDFREYYEEMRDRFGRMGGPNIASDLPSQLGWDSDDPRSHGEVGMVGVAIDSLRDFEIIYSPFTGDNELDQISTNWTINAAANQYLAFYVALAKKRGVPLAGLRCTPQNDILKEFAARGLATYPPRHAMRLTRDSFVFGAEHLPKANTISVCMEHLQAAGATFPQAAGFALSNGIAYVRLGIEAGLDVDQFVQRFTFRGFGSQQKDIHEGVASGRAARRVWARIMRERFGAKSDRTCMLRGGEQAWGPSYMYTHKDQPIQNIIRATISGVIQAFGGGQIVICPFDEANSLGHSIEAQQIARDTARILMYESKVTEVPDPFAGSYAVESLTDDIEEQIWAVIDEVDAIGGAVEAVESGYYRQQISASAWKSQRDLEDGTRVWVGVNSFKEPDDLPLSLPRHLEYDRERMEAAEERQVAALKTLRGERDNREVSRCLAELRTVAEKPDENVLPTMVECAEAYVTLGEMTEVLTDVFGEWRGFGY